MINALPVLIMLGLNLFVGRLADRAADWRQVIVAGALLSAAIPFGLFFARASGASCWSGRPRRCRSQRSVRWPMLPRCA